ncbi:uncharacterized protein LOC132012179 isoform X5 [Mustela nigripes]|uniref:uncharacterized protein LOC132012179 isoform X5 n=1 Tax=Mustela nigripes TaxID=77151 RepID=UPI002815B474|nr:uncharacterized protein LOC132012179 isoform X5 [Mustela nigripes]
MPREKEGKQKTKGTPLPIVPILRKFLKTYEKHCVQTQTAVCPAIRQDLKTSINNEQILRKFMLVRPGDSPTSILPISLEPLLMTIRDECYMLGKEICIWSLQLSNPEIARLASLLELKGSAACPFTSLELTDCRMDLWSLRRLGRALPRSHLRSLILDYSRFGKEEVESLFSGLENNQRLQALSLRYCGLGPQSGPRLGTIICQTAISELHLDGNFLQCSGALALLRPIADYAEMQGREQPAMAPPDPGSPPHQLQGECWGPGPSTLWTYLKEGNCFAIKSDLPRGTWVAQWVKASAFGSGHDPRVLGSSPALGSLLSRESASFSLSLPASLLVISVK